MFVSIKNVHVILGKHTLLAWKSERSFMIFFYILHPYFFFLLVRTKIISIFVDYSIQTVKINESNGHLFRFCRVTPLSKKT
ncbi:hypothetical protein HMPREF1553_00723 [Porphyromonas gingivalis F0568]|nr:hypothetical protein HMPREF1553_00723 [Porphyromonas gingivalis F0568]